MNQSNQPATITTDLHTISSRMLEIEHINMKYNQETDFGNKPNGQESEIEALLKEWDDLKVERHKAKNTIDR